MMRWKEGKKYRILEEDWRPAGGGRVYRIQAIRDFEGIKAGTLGGYVGCERNLAHDGTCWIHDESICMDNAVVYESAQMYGNSRAFDYARIHGEAVIQDRSGVMEYGDIYGKTLIKDFAIVSGTARIYNNATLSGEAIVKGPAEVYGHAVLKDEVLIVGASIYEHAVMEQKARAGEKAIVRGYSTIRGNVELLPLSIVYGTSQMPELLEGSRRARVMQGDGLSSMAEQKAIKRIDKVFR